MEPLAASGAWAAFVPVAKQGQRYKYQIRTRHGALLLKSDPYGHGVRAAARDRVDHLPAGARLAGRRVDAHARGQ